jgi:hydrogenase maturation protein HypF
MIDHEPETTTLRRLQLRLTGRVQGVGFRPFVYRLATELNLTGSVMNTGDGVTIDIQGSTDQVGRFLESLYSQLPPHACIDHRDITELQTTARSVFRIEDSPGSMSASAIVIPDLATCPECLAEILNPTNRRYRYPFTNCTHCGPRYSIIESVPYDRPRTTMRHFTMCGACRTEYDNPLDRRFHAQPNACPECGPHLGLWSFDGRVLSEHDDALSQACDAIQSGRIVALKGLGGFQLLVDARNEDAVALLRRRKHRPSKPFALMYPDVEAVRSDCEVTEAEVNALRSPAAPIVLLARTKAGYDAVAESVAPRNPYLGVMLPYTPLHHLILRELRFPIVATSGNLSEEPICIDEREAAEQLGDIADFFLVHNRPIARPLDDSVVHVVNGSFVILRSARGYAPTTLSLDSAPPAILATGAHLKNTIAFTSGAQVMVSQHIGDLSGPKSHAAMEAAIESAAHLYGASFSRAVCDLHPDYHSTHVARRVDGHPLPVQHHYAHVLACMLEHNLKPPVLGVSWDGTGLGTDGTIWGGEFLLVTKGGFERVAHLRTFPLPGGERAVVEPRRSALGLLYEIWGPHLSQVKDLSPIRQYSDAELRILLRLIEKGLNTHLTSSAGRLFDGLASLLGLAHVVTFEAEAAMLLQFAAETSRDRQTYEFALMDKSRPAVLDWEPMVRMVVDDIRKHTPLDTIAARCHNTLVEMIVMVADRSEMPEIVLTGGCFQNRLLLERTIEWLQAGGKRVYWHRRIPTNDGGIAAGQAAALIEKMQSES